jgi:flagellar biosynthesis protein FliP
MTHPVLTLLFVALLAPSVHAAETSDVAIPPALAEALAEVEPAALEELVAEAKAKAAAKAKKVADAAAVAEAKAAADAKAKAEADALVLAQARAEADALAAEAAEAKAVAAAKASEANALQAALTAATPAVESTPPEAAAPPETADVDVPDPKLAAVLASLDGKTPERVETPTPSLSAGVNPMAKAGTMFLFALVLGGFLFLHPRTREVLLARLRGQRPTDLEDEGFVVRSRRSLGTGQALVDVELDGVRLLVGVSPGRMDLLHAWGATPHLAAFSSAPSPALIAQPEPAPAAPPQPEPAPAPTPSVDQLLEAWKGTVQAAATDQSPDELDDADANAPWWLEGASTDEKRRIEEQATASDGIAESVLARLRGARDVSLSERTGVGTPPPANRQPAAPAPKVIRRKKGRALGTFALVGAVCLPALLGADLAMAEELTNSPALAVSLDGGGAGTSTAVKLLLTLTMMAVAPAVVLSMTSFTRMIVVFSLLRQAVGVQQAPPNQVLIGLALFLTWFVMGPTFEQVNELAVEPYTTGDISEGEAISAAMGPMRDFMMANTRENDLALFLRLSSAPRPKTRADVPTNALVPAFLISELKTAFQIGFLIYIPFLIIDVVVSTVLLAMGMMVLPPVVISLPFKLLLFVFVDGWNLLVSSMVQSFA